jgi:hypothetical protein
MSIWDDETGYDRSDPKHPGWYDAACDRADIDRKRAKEDLHRAEWEEADREAEAS